MERISFSDATKNICIDATAWIESKFYKRILPTLEVVALRIEHYTEDDIKYEWILAISNHTSKGLELYGIDDYRTPSSKLVDVLKELDLI